MESYGSWDALQQAFVEFANKVPFYGAVIACVDDGRGPRAGAPHDAAGHHLWLRANRAPTSSRATTCMLEAFGSRCRVRSSVRRRTVETRLAPSARAGPPQPAERARRGGSRARSRRAVRADRLGARRVPRRGAPLSDCAAKQRGVMVVDDYGHHPTEIAAVIAAARAGIDRRRRGRLSAASLHANAGSARRRSATRCRRADEIVLTDIYRRGRGAHSGRHRRDARRRRASAAAVRCTLVKSLDDVPAAVAALARPSDLVITLGAGSIGTLRRSHSRRRWRARAAEVRRDERQGADREELQAREGAARARRKTRALAALAWRAARWRAALAAGRIRRLPGDEPRLHASALQVRRITVHGNVRLSSGEVRALVDGLRGTSILTADLPRYRRRLLESPWVADVGAAAGAAVDGRGVRLGAHARWGCAGSAVPAVPHRFARDRDRRVRPAVRGVRPAHHRRSRAGAVERRAGIDEARAELAARVIEAVAPPEGSCAARVAD